MSQDARYARAASAVAPLLATVLVGCPGRLEDPGRFMRDAAVVLDGGAVDAGGPLDGGGAPVDAGAPSACPPEVEVTEVFEARCGGLGCHGVSNPAAGLDLVSADLGARLAGRTTVNPACSGLPVASAATPRDSSLFLKVSGTECGARMPIGSALSDDEIACVAAWISAMDE